MSFPLSANLVFGVQADSSTVSGSNLTAWPDESGKGNHLVTIGSVVPTRVTGPNGAPVIRFANSADCYVRRNHGTHPLTDLPIGTAPRTVCLLVAYIDDSLGNGGLEYGTATVWQKFGVGISGTSGSENARILMGSAGADYSSSLGLPDFTFTFIAAELYLDPGDSLYKVKVHRDTSSSAAQTRDASTANAINTVLDFLQMGGSVGMDVAMGAIYDGALSTEELAILRQNFVAKYVTTTPALQEIRTNGTSCTIRFNQAVQVGANGSGGFAFTMSGGAVTASYASGTGTEVLTYTLSRAMEEGETGTVTYTQPTNGIETIGGTDVPTTASFQVNNVSSDTPVSVGWVSPVIYSDAAQTTTVANASNIRACVYQNIATGQHIKTLTNRTIAGGVLTLEDSDLGDVTDLVTVLLDGTGWFFKAEGVPLIDLDA